MMEYALKSNFSGGIKMYAYYSYLKYARIIKPKKRLPSFDNILTMPSVYLYLQNR